MNPLRWAWHTITFGHDYHPYTWWDGARWRTSVWLHECGCGSMYSMGMTGTIAPPTPENGDPTP